VGVLDHQVLLGSAMDQGLDNKFFFYFEQISKYINFSSLTDKYKFPVLTQTVACPASRATNIVRSPHHSVIDKHATDWVDIRCSGTPYKTRIGAGHTYTTGGNYKSLQN
jgi:hypothetical protein